jgi:4-diphosphocytidyl-2-C-methyl-D-erythritol kinase
MCLRKMSSAPRSAVTVPPVTVLPMTILTELASAKINLTLTVHGRRADGYHELESLVAFADVGDTLTMTTAAPFALSMTGPFAKAIGTENLITRAVDLALAHEPTLRIGAIMLDKQLPVAAGIGGGSADAAATLRLIARANPGRVPETEWAKIASQIGADVPVCLRSETTIMRGFGEQLSERLPLPQLHAVLVNTRAPEVAGKTGLVFATLAAELCPTIVRDAWFHVMARLGNDLEKPAASIMPDVQIAKRALAALPGFIAIRLSGAGPTCFALYADAAAAQATRIAIAAQYPTWWVAATTIG